MVQANFELFELLRERIGEEAARMISEAVPPARELATKSDIDRLTAATKSDIDRLAATTKSDIDRLATDIDRLDRTIVHTAEEFRLFVKSAVTESENRILRWMLGLFVPVWLGVAAMVVTLLVKF